MCNLYIPTKGQSGDHRARRYHMVVTRVHNRTRHNITDLTPTQFGFNLQTVFITLQTFSETIQVTNSSSRGSIQAVEEQQRFVPLLKFV
jgi:hypothetical protein